MSRNSKQPNLSTYSSSRTRISLREGKKLDTIESELKQRKIRLFMNLETGYTNYKGIGNSIGKIFKFNDKLNKYMLEHNISKLRIISQRIVEKCSILSLDNIRKFFSSVILELIVYDIEAQNELYGDLSIKQLLKNIYFNIISPGAHTNATKAKRRQEADEFIEQIILEVTKFKEDLITFLKDKVNYELEKANRELLKKLENKVIHKRKLYDNLFKHFLDTGETNIATIIIRLENLNDYNLNEEDFPSIPSSFRRSPKKGGSIKTHHQHKKKNNKKYKHKNRTKKCRKQTLQNK